MTRQLRRHSPPRQPSGDHRDGECRDLVHRKLTGPKRQHARRRLAELSEREREVLRLVGQGESNAVIAKRLFVSEATVKTYVSRLLGKLELANRTQAAILAHEAGLLDG